MNGNFQFTSRERSHPRATPRPNFAAPPSATGPFAYADNGGRGRPTMGKGSFFAIIVALVVLAVAMASSSQIAALFHHQETNEAGGGFSAPTSDAKTDVQNAINEDRARHHENDGSDSGSTTGDGKLPDGNVDDAKQAIQDILASDPMSEERLRDALTELHPPFTQDAIEGALKELHIDFNKVTQQAVMARLKIMPTSASGLVRELTGAARNTGFTKEQVMQAITTLNINFDDQAVKYAQMMVRVGGFSKQGMVKIFQHEGFTAEQTQYAMKIVPVDFRRNACQAASRFAKALNISGEKLKEALERAGFTPDEVSYGMAHPDDTPPKY